MRHSSSNKQDASILINRDALADRDRPASTDGKVQASANWDALVLANQNTPIPINRDISVDKKIPENRNAPALVNGKASVDRDAQVLIDREEVPVNWNILAIVATANMFARVFYLNLYFLAFAFYLLICLISELSRSGNSL